MTIWSCGISYGIDNEDYALSRTTDLVDSLPVSSLSSPISFPIFVYHPYFYLNVLEIWIIFRNEKEVGEHFYIPLFYIILKTFNAFNVVTFLFRPVFKSFTFNNYHAYLSGRRSKWTCFFIAQRKRCCIFKKISDHYFKYPFILIFSFIILLRI